MKRILMSLLVLACGAVAASAGVDAPDAQEIPVQRLCGGIGSPTRICNLTGNAIISGNHDAVRTAAAGTKNGQGLDQQTTSRTNVLVQHDFYSGHLDLDVSVFYRYGLRAHGPQFI